jgi:hypothetical protein
MGVKMTLKCISAEEQERILKETKVPYTLYHGTNRAADICLTGFDIKKTGTATDPGDFGQGAYFHTQKGFSKMYGKNIFEAVVNLKNPLVLDFEGARDDAYRQLEEMAKNWGDPVRGYDLETAEHQAGKPLSAEEYQKAIDQKAQELGIDAPEDSLARRLLARKVTRNMASTKWREELLKGGYDGVVAHGYEGKGTTTVVAFNEDSINLVNCEPKNTEACKICEC